MNSGQNSAAHLAADELAAKKRARKRFAAERRQVLRYSRQARTQEAVRQSVLKVEGISPSEPGRVIRQLGAHLDEFRGIHNRLTFRKKAIAWALRIARLSVKLEELTPRIARAAGSVSGYYCGPSTIQSRVSRRLPEYAGDVDDLPAFTAWALETTLREARGLAELAGWISKYTNAVYAGAWDVLRTCLDLEISDAPDEIASRTWQYIGDYPAEFLDTRTPLHCRFRAKARSLAKQWKSDYLRNREKNGTPKFVDNPEEEERKILFYAGSGKLPVRSIKLGPGDEHAYEPVKPIAATLNDYEKPLDYHA